MKKLILMFALFLPVITSIALAASNDKVAIEKGAVDKDDDDDQGPEIRGDHRHGPCGKLDISAEQKARIKEEEFKFENERIDLEAKMKHARLNYEKIISDTKSDLKDVKAATQEVANSVAKLVTAEENFKTDIVFKIFKSEQRQEALHCEAIFHNFREGKGGGPGGEMRGKEHGRGPEHGPRREARFGGGPDREFEGRE